MSISRQIVEQHGGHLGLESEPEKGTTFLVDLPTASPEPRTHDNPSSPSKRGDPAPTRILVIDDEESIRRLMKRVLARLGHQVDAVCDGNAALQKLQQNDYHIVFLDLNIPGRPGQHVFNWIKANRRDVAERTVILTGDTLRPDTLDFLAREGVLHLLKPFQLAELAEIIKQIPAP